MKQFSVLLILIFTCFSLAAQTGSTFYIPGKNVKILNREDTVSGATLIIENSTRHIPGYLYNTGNGVTQFKLAMDTVFVRNDSIIGVRGRSEFFIATLTGASIKTKLESLSGDNRLDASAIKNLPAAGEGGIEVDPVYSVSAASGITSSNITTWNNHLSNTSNPHSVTKAQLGLGNVNNTSDANKPISTATQTALDAKLDKNDSTLANRITATQVIVQSNTGLIANKVDKSDSTMANRITATQVIVQSNTDAITGNTASIESKLDKNDSTLANRITSTQNIVKTNTDNILLNASAIANKVDKVAGKGLSSEDYTTAEKTKLSGIAPGATANSSDATLLNRANHTGTQTANTISDFQTQVSSNTNVAANTSARHSHANKALLDSYTQTEANLADAVAKKHSEETGATIKSKLEVLTGDNRLDASAIKNLPTGEAGPETDPVYSASAAAGITGSNITTWNNKVDKSDSTLANRITATQNIVKTNTDAITANTSSIEEKLDKSDSTLANRITATQNIVKSNTDAIGANASSIEAKLDKSDSTLANRITATQVIVQSNTGLIANKLDKSDSTLANRITATQVIVKSNTDAIATNTSSIASKLDKSDSTLANRITATQNIVKTNTDNIASNSSAIANKVDKVAGKGLSSEDYTTAEKTKLSGIATGATANSSDATLKNRSNHTGTQLANTISDFQAQVSANTNVSANTSARHTHSNKALLDTYTQTEANIADAVAKKHDAETGASIKTKLEALTGTNRLDASAIKNLPTGEGGTTDTSSLSRRIDSLKPVKAYRVTLIGQSIAQGAAHVSSLTAYPLNLDTFHFTDTFRRVYIWNPISANYERLIAGVNNRAANDASVIVYPPALIPDNTYPAFGSEIGIAQRWEEETTEGILYIDKFVADGQKIGRFTKDTGAVWLEMVTQRALATNWLKARKITAYDKGFVWIQGNADRGATQAYYQNELTKYIRDLQLGNYINNSSVICFPLFPNNITGFEGQWDANIENAKLAVATTNPNIYTWRWDNTTIPEDHLHADAYAELNIGYKAYKYIFNSSYKTAWKDTAVSSDGGGSTELLAAGSDFSNTAWVKAAMTVTTNQALDPDGTSLADKVVPTTANAPHMVHQTVTKAASAKTYVFSVYAKTSAGTNQIALVVQNVAATDATYQLFDINAGTKDGSITGAYPGGAGNFQFVSSSITSAANGFVKCTLTFTSNSETSMDCIVQTYTAADGDTYAGNGTDGIYLYKASLIEQ